MISPAEINIAKLPSVALEDRKQLPQAIKVLSGRTNVPMERIVEQAIAQYLEQQQGNIAA